MPKLLTQIQKLAISRIQAHTTSCRVRGRQSRLGRARLQMMGLEYVKDVESNDRKGKKQVLEN
jgi:hypothetical protein